MTSAGIIRTTCSTLLLYIRAGLFRHVIDWVLFLSRSFIFTSFAKIIEFKTLIDYLDIEEGDKVCDLGCGSGNNDVLASLTGARVCGVDIDWDTLRVGKRTARSLNAQVGFCVADLNRALGFKSESFDKAVSYCVLEHLDNPDNFLREVHRILRPGGTLAVSVDSFSNRRANRRLRDVHRKICRVKKYYTESELRILFNRCGFSVIKHSFLIKAPISSRFFETLLRAFFNHEECGRGFALKVLKLFMPFALLVCLISDSFYDDSKGGYWLTLAAVMDS